MRASCAQWLDTVTMPGAAVFQTREQVRESLTMAFSAGYEAGRKSINKANRNTE